jgi:hypothetical protein
MSAERVKAAPPHPAASEPAPVKTAARRQPLERLERVW